MAMLPLEVLTLSGRVARDRVGGNITVGSKVSGYLDWSSTWFGDVEGTGDELDVDMDMSAADSGTDVGGAFPSLDFIIQG